MTSRVMTLLAGLGLLAGAGSFHPAGAQQPTPKPPAPARPAPTPIPVKRDTIPARPAPADTIIRRDTTVTIPIPPQADTIVKRDSVLPVPPKPAAPKDSVQPPLARAEMPKLVEGVRPELRWTRDSIYFTGALTVADLLERVPGLTTLRGGYLQAPVVGAYMGGTTRIRVFFDGLEMDAIDPRMGGSLDLSGIPIWSAEEIRIERGADEVRIYLRSWRAERTTPYTRVDIGTGDQETNLYRAYFGKRWKHGEALQFAAQQYSTTPSRLGGSSSEFGFLTRVGWARRGWSGDVVILRGTPHRGVMYAAERLDTIRSLGANRTTAYARLAKGDPEHGAWMQLIAGAEGYRFTGVRRDSTALDTLPLPSGDTTRYVGQYVATGGWSAGPISASGAARLRTFMGSSYFTPSLRAGYSTRMLAASLLAEGKGLDSTSRIDAAVRVTPLSFVTLDAALGRRSATRDTAGTDASSSSMRLEGALRLKGLWFGGGVMRRDSTDLIAPIVFSRHFTGPTPEGEAKGTFASIRGSLGGPFRLDLMGIKWDDSSGFYRPRYQTRSELTFANDFRRRFPSGNFGMIASLVHEYRSHVMFPTDTGLARATGWRQITFHLEIRLLQAQLTYQFRNLLGAEYAPVPTYPMPRQTQFYGVRWEFWN